MRTIFGQHRLYRMLWRASTYFGASPALTWLCTTRSWASQTRAPRRDVPIGAACMWRGAQLCLMMIMVYLQVNLSVWENTIATDWLSSLARQLWLLPSGKLNQKVVGIGWFSIMPRLVFKTAKIYNLGSNTDAVRYLSP